jgi:hypothetical protein
MAEGRQKMMHVQSSRWSLPHPWEDGYRLPSEFGPTVFWQEHVRRLKVIVLLPLIVVALPLILLFVTIKALALAARPDTTDKQENSASFAYWVHEDISRVVSWTLSPVGRRGSGERSLRQLSTDFRAEESAPAHDKLSAWSIVTPLLTTVIFILIVLVPIVLIPNDPNIEPRPTDGKIISPQSGESVSETFAIRGTTAGPDDKSFYVLIRAAENPWYDVAEPPIRPNTDWSIETDLSEFPKANVYYIFLVAVPSNSDPIGGQEFIRFIPKGANAVDTVWVADRN